jgi:hypothetical protein
VPVSGDNRLKVIFQMNYDKSLTTVKRLRWVMRQKSRISKLLPISVSIDCPFCATKVHAGDFFCCSELEHAWALTETNTGKPVFAENHS